MHRDPHPSIRNPRKLKDGSIVPSQESISERSVMSHFMTIRSVFAHAARIGVVVKRNSPFVTDKVPIKPPQALKIGLYAEAVAAPETVELEQPYHHARNLWLFSFYLAGMRASDVFRLNWTDIQNGCLYCAMGDTAKACSLKLPEKAPAIFLHCEPMKETNDDCMFPELKGVTLGTLSN